MKTQLDWPPTYTIRKSRKAKYVKIHIDAHRGLEVVVPYGVAQQDAIRFLESKRAWVERYLPMLDVWQSEVDYELPESIDFPCMQRGWQVRYNDKRLASSTMRQHADCLYVTGDVLDKAGILKLLHHWVKRQAKYYLTRCIKEISNDINLPFSRLSFRNQKTRWGSCSSEKNISINYKLIFLPEALIRYVLIHELCHTQHMNHSRRFWRLVNTHEPNYQALDKALKHAEQHIPNWAKNRV